MSLYLEFHFIQGFVPSNLNRDDSGSPKDAIFGGHRRARISSQCLKRSIREYCYSKGLVHDGFKSIRTKQLRSLLLKGLIARGYDDHSSLNATNTFLKILGLGLKADGKTEYLILISQAEVLACIEFIEKKWIDLTSANESINKKESKGKELLEIAKQAKSLFNGGRSIDVALYGRMLADIPQANQDAALQVAHAISTHRVEREFDYFTAIDDIESGKECFASMIGIGEFNSATFYRYAVLDVRKLQENLGENTELVLMAIESLLYSIVCAIPSGKQNSFAAHNLPDFIGVSIRQSPINLANAFEKPVQPRYEQSLTELSVITLSAYESKLASVYGSTNDRWAHIDLTGQWQKENSHSCVELRDLMMWVHDAVMTQ